MKINNTLLPTLGSMKKKNQIHLTAWKQKHNMSKFVKYSSSWDEIYSIKWLLHKESKWFNDLSSYLEGKTN